MTNREMTDVEVLEVLRGYYASKASTQKGSVDLAFDIPTVYIANALLHGIKALEQKSSESKADYWENRYLNLKQKYSWIPCDKKMPQTEVLCCNTYGELFIGYVFKDDESETGYSAESNESFLYDCVAWMSLPQAYGKKLVID